MSAKDSEVLQRLADRAEGQIQWCQDQPSRERQRETHAALTRAAALARAIEEGRWKVVPVAHRWLDELRDRMEHCISAADEGEDYAVPRDYLDAMTTLGLMKKVGRSKWAPTEEGEAFAERRPTLPVEIYGKFYEVPIPVQLHIVNLRDKLTSPAHTSEARDAVAEEVARAVRKFPTWPTDPLHAVAVLGEEFGELTKAVLQSVYEPHKVKPDEVRMEAVQTAAMAMRFLQSIDAYVYSRSEQHSQDAAMRQEGE